MTTSQLPPNVGATDVAMIEIHIPPTGERPTFRSAHMRHQPLSDDPAAVARAVLSRPDAGDVEILIRAYGVPAALVGMQRVRDEAPTAAHRADLAWTVLGKVIKDLAREARLQATRVPAAVVMTVTVDDLPLRAAEVLSRRRTGTYDGTALKALGDRMQADGESCLPSPVDAAAERTITQTLERMAAMPMPEADPDDPLLAMIQDDSPLWNHMTTYRRGDWRDHVGEAVRAIWKALPEGVRLAIARDAQEVANELADAALDHDDRD